MLLRGYMHTAILCGDLGRGDIIDRVMVGSGTRRLGRVRTSGGGEQRGQPHDAWAARTKDQCPLIARCSA